MKESSSYKHLTVILAALLTTTVIAIIALVILLSTDPAGSADDPADRTTVNTPDRGSTGPGGTSGSPNTDPPSTGGDPTTTTTTVEGNGTTSTPITSEPPATTPPVSDDPPVPSGPINGSAYGDKLGSLQVYGEWNTIDYDEATGSCTLKLSLYCDSYSIGIGPRQKNYVIINDQRVEFTTERIDVTTNEHQTRTLLYSTEYEIQKDAPTDRFPVHIEFGWHYQGRYSGEFAEWLTLKVDFVA